MMATGHGLVADLPRYRGGSFCCCKHGMETERNLLSTPLLTRSMRCTGTSYKGKTEHLIAYIMIEICKVGGLTLT